MILNQPRNTLLLAVIAFLVGALAFWAFVNSAIAAPPPIDPIVAADHAAHLPVLTSPLAHADPPTSIAWDAWRAGWVGLGVLAFLGIGGAWAFKSRGYISKRWPRLNVGRAWAIVSIASSAAISMIPLAAAGDLGIAAIKLQIGASLLYLVPGKLGSDEGSAVS